MRLGGFVIHGGCAAMLGACLDSLTAVCDDVVAVDSAPTEESESIARQRGVRTVFHRWEGYGGARAAAVRELRGSDHYVFFLDSDEWLEPDSVRAILAWKSSSPRLPYYCVNRRDHAELSGRRFVYRTEHHVRLVRADAARWEPSMIVHEALPPAPTSRLDATIEHLFATSVDAMASKCELYAMLWALRFRDSPRRVKSPVVQHAFHLVRELILRGALLRGGRDAIPLANAIARHHARKYELLAQVRAGAHGEPARSFARGEYAELFAQLPEEVVSGRAPAFTRNDTPAAQVELRDREDNATAS